MTGLDWLIVELLPEIISGEPSKELWPVKKIRPAVDQR